ncbi:MAG: YSC84-related protein [Acidobacteriota bacterium]
MRKRSSILAVVLIIAGAGLAGSGRGADQEGTDKAAGSRKAARAEKAEARAARHRTEIDHMAQETLDELFADSDKAKELFGRAVGYAVFSNVKFSLGVSGGGGSGVAVDKATKKHTYMRMGTAGLSLGLGGQKYQLVFLFQDSKTFSSFVNKGWEANAQANAAAGTKGVNAETSFTDGLAVFQLTDKGLMLQADISGTKYWQSKRLNGKPAGKQHR